MRMLTIALGLLISVQGFARQTSDTIWAAERISATTNSSTISMDAADKYDITATVTETQPANDTAISGVGEVQTLTFPAKASITARDYIVFYDAGGTAWAVAMNKGGADAAPTGAAWVAIAAANKSNCDISGATSAADVAAAAELCVDALTGLSAVIATDDSAADGTMLFTQVESGPTTDPVPHNLGDTGAGTLLGVQTTAGVLGKVSVSGNTINFGNHGYLTGLKGRLTTTSALPTGLSTSTDYWLIKVDPDFVKVATSMANAVAGTAIDITAIGVGTHTFVVDTDLEADIKLQKNDAPSGSDAVWVDVGSSTQAVDAGGTFNWTGVDFAARQLRVVFLGDSSEATVTAYMNGKD